MLGSKAKAPIPEAKQTLRLRRRSEASSQFQQWKAPDCHEHRSHSSSQDNYESTFPTSPCQTDALRLESVRPQPCTSSVSYVSCCPGYSVSRLPAPAAASLTAAASQVLLTAVLRRPCGHEVADWRPVRLARKTQCSRLASKWLGRLGRPTAARELKP